MVGVQEMAHVVLSMTYPAGSAGEIVQFAIELEVVGMWFVGCPTVSFTKLGEKDTVGLAINTAKFSVVVPDPFPLRAVMVYTVEEEGAVGTPVMMQVALPMEMPSGSAGEAVQIVGVPPERVGV